MRTPKKNVGFWLDILSKKVSVTEIARQYGVTKSHVYNTRKKVSFMTYSPKIDQGDLICSLCMHSSEEFVIYNDPKTNVPLGLVCPSCWNRLLTGVQAFPTTGKENKTMPEIAEPLAKVIAFFTDCLQQPKWGPKFVEFATQTQIGDAIEVLEGFLDQERDTE